MVRESERPKLSVILPTLNEAIRLPLLVAELLLIDDEIELIIVDAGSKDLTRFLGEIAGAKVLSSSKANRGYQLKIGANAASGEWLLFLHADCNITRKSSKHLKDFMQLEQDTNCAFFFNFKTKNKGIIFRLLEIVVFLRSNLLNTPYGDQGLLINKETYLTAGGYKDLYIMEDLEFISRLTKCASLKCLGVDLITDGKRWAKGQVIQNGIKNAKLRYRWRKGEDTESLYKEYYSKK